MKGPDIFSRFELWLASTHSWDILLEVNGDKDFTEVVIEDLVSDNKSMFYKVKLLQK